MLETKKVGVRSVEEMPSARPRIQSRRVQPIVTWRPAYPEHSFQSRTVANRRRLCIGAQKSTLPVEAAYFMHPAEPRAFFTHLRTVDCATAAMSEASDVYPGITGAEFC